MPDERTIWKRRVVLMGAVGLLIAVPVTIAVRDGDSSGDTPPAAPAPELPAVGSVQFDRDLGVELRLPEGWKRKREGDAVSFTSDDGSTLIAISAPGPAKDVKPIQDSAVKAIKLRYRAVKVGRTPRKQRLGGRPAEVAAISARHPKKRVPLRILVATAKGEKRAYLVEVFASGPSAVVEAQLLLDNLSLEG